MHEVELMVVGGGPAGCAAAQTAARLGVRTMLVDENPIDAAYLQRNVPKWYGSRLPAGGISSNLVYRWLATRPDLQAAAEAGAEVLTQHAVWGTFADRVVGLYDGHKTWLVQAGQLILTTGTTDLHLAFPGWTLGGVLGGGGALHLMDLYGRLDARRLVVLGSGNLGLTVARRALETGVEVAGIVEIEGEARGDAALRESLLDSGVPFYFGYTIKEATGGAEVERVVLAAVGDGNRLTGEEIDIEADTLCVAIGQQPAIELAYLSGCVPTYDVAGGGLLPRHDVNGRTSQDGILVAGDLAGAYDAAFPDPDIAARSGRLAAITAAEALRRIDAATAGRMRAEIGGAVAPPPARNGHDSYPSPWHRIAESLATDDLIICRCEEVTRGAVLAAIDLVGIEHPDEVKRVSRAGMGLCQGRGCRPLIAGLLAGRSNRPLAELPLASYRPPLRSLPLAALATEEARPLPEYAAFTALEERLTRDVQSGLLHPTAMQRFRYRIGEMLYTAAENDAGDAEVGRMAAELERQIRYRLER
jgi:thioredoxin reductase